jgi:hypothetical protein
MRDLGGTLSRKTTRSRQNRQRVHIAVKPVEKRWPADDERLQVSPSSTCFEGRHKSEHAETLVGRINGLYRPSHRSINRISSLSRLLDSQLERAEPSTGDAVPRRPPGGLILSVDPAARSMAH